MLVTERFFIYPSSKWVREVVSEGLEPRWTTCLWHFDEAARKLRSGRLKGINRVKPTPRMWNFHEVKDIHINNTKLRKLQHWLGGGGYLVPKQSWAWQCLFWKSIDYLIWFVLTRFVSCFSSLIVTLNLYNLTAHRKYYSSKKNTISPNS